MSISHHIRNYYEQLVAEEMLRFGVILSIWPMSLVWRLIVCPRATFDMKLIWRFICLQMNW